MPRTRTANGHHDIHAALRKLKDEANEKELQLIDFVASLYENIRDTKDQAVEKVQDTVSVVNTSVHMHPWRFIGGAALCGLVAGLFIRR